jgi:hypothetical protein
LPESYLAACTLFNLSGLEDAKTMVLNFVPSQKDEEAESVYSYQRPEDDSWSTIRTLESALKDYAPYVTKAKYQTVHSVEQQAARWCMNVVRNLVTDKDNAVVVGTKTAIPVLAAFFLDTSQRDLGLWTRDSLEDACLMVLVRCATYDECLPHLNRPETARALSKLSKVGGIHQTRAVLLLHRFQEVDDDKKSRFGETLASF